MPLRASSRGQDYHYLTDNVPRSFLLNGSKTTECFERAVPVWPSKYLKQMNRSVGFHAQVPAKQACRLRIAACAVYRFWVNGEFAGGGPARGPHGKFRVDEWELIGPEEEPLHVAIEVLAYNVRTFSLPIHEPFLCAEILADGTPLKWTAEDSNGFSAWLLPYRVQKVQRYSYMRGFIEAVRLYPGQADWQTGKTNEPEELIQRIPVETFLPRRLSPFYMSVIAFNSRCRISQEQRGNQPGRAWDNRPEWMERAVTWVGRDFDGFAAEELEINTKGELQLWQSSKVFREAQLPIELKHGESLITQLPGVRTGMPGASIQVTQASVAVILFDEKLTNDGDVFCHRGESAQWIWLELSPGDFHFEALEPYSLKYCKLLVISGQVTISNMWLREYAACERPTIPANLDAEQKILWAAAVETFRQNALDTFMDCPSRERAGYCNDSFYAARGAYLLSRGQSKVEDVFLENYALAPDPVPGLPQGMLPMCYPGDFPEGLHIPNLPCWLVCQLEEYLKLRNGSKAWADALRPKVLGYFDYLERFRKTAEGLIENLPGWIFIEWTGANSKTEGVNLPVNFLYADALEAASRVFEVPSLADRASAIKHGITRFGYCDGWFHDQLRRDSSGTLCAEPYRSEICQYHAFRSRVASPETHPDLWKTLLERGGLSPEKPRVQGVEKPELIMGVFLRLDLLARFGEWERLDRELRSTFLHMAQETGTIHERIDRDNSFNHGLGSHVAVWIDQVIQGQAQKKSKPLAAGHFHETGYPS